MFSSPKKIFVRFKKVTEKYFLGLVQKSNNWVTNYYFIL